MEPKEKFKMLCDLTYKLVELKFNKEPELLVGECSASVLHQLMKASCDTPIIIVPNNASPELRQEALARAKQIAEGIEAGILPEYMKLTWGWH